MMYSSYISSFLVTVILISVNVTTGLSCPSWWLWCPDTSNNTAITTTKPSMTTQAGSYCKCNSSSWDRQERIRLVTDLMRVAFQNITNGALNIIQTSKFKSNPNKIFDLNATLASFANGAPQPDVFAFLLAGGLFTTAWDQVTNDYKLDNETFLTMVFSQLYVYPLANALQSIAIEHGTSIGVFRAGQTKKYGGVCSLVDDTGNPPSNLTGYLWQQQCNINLMYLVGFSLNSTCFDGTSDKIFLPTNIETAFDNHFIPKYSRFVRSAIISYSNATASMDVLVGLYFRSNEALSSIDGVLQNMSRINGTYCGGVYVASTQFVLVNCTWYSPENLTSVCMNTNVINPTIPRSSSPLTETTIVSTHTTLAETTIVTTQTTLAETTVATTPLVTPSTQTTSITETSSTILITAPTTVPPISSTAPSTLSTTPYESSLPLSSTQQSVDGITTTATTSEKPSLTTNLTDSNKSTSPSLQANAIDVSTSSPNTTVKELSSTTTPGSGQNAVSSVPHSQVTNNVNGNMTTMTTTVSDKNATTYDPDPLFKAMVPLMTKKYNDPLLLRHVGTMSPVTSNTNFYWVTIPICICAIVFSMLCLLCLQVDWLIVCSKKQDSKKLIN